MKLFGKVKREMSLAGRYLTENSVCNYKWFRPKWVSAPQLLPLLFCVVLVNEGNGDAL